MFTLYQDPIINPNCMYLFYMSYAVKSRCKNPYTVLIHRNLGTSNVVNVCHHYYSNSKGLFEVQENTMLEIFENHRGNFKMESKAWIAAINRGQMGGEWHSAALRENS